MENGQRLCSWLGFNYIINFSYGMASQIMKDNFGREWELVTLKDKKKKQKEKNKILYPETDGTIEEQLSELFEDDRPKSME